MAFPTLTDATYRIEAKIGSGGGGVVYKTWHTRLQKYVVLKRIKDDSKLIRSEYARRETDILKNLKHAHLPQIYDFLEDPSGIYTVMEFIPGHSFAELLKEGQKFEQTQIVRWAEQLSDALEYLHGQDPPILHGDIKPSNIMLTDKGDVCLIDFNISLVLDGEDTVSLGLSHGYTSPEQYGPRALQGNKHATTIGSASTDDASPNATTAGEPFTNDAGPSDASSIMADVDTEMANTGMGVTDTSAQMTDVDTEMANVNGNTESPSQQSSSERRKLRIRMDTRSDVYSLGATLYHLAVGEKPAISTGEVKPLGEYGIPFNEAFIYIIERCMESDPSRRFQKAADLHHAVLNIHKHDKRWKLSQAKMMAAAIILPFAFTIFAITFIFGLNTMAHEKEERYYSAVFRIENDADAWTPYMDALDMFWDRIDPYAAMARRLWNDGDMEACRIYIEENLGNIAKFQTVPDACYAIGDIYYILGNCHYYQSVEPDYDAARGNFEVAVRFVNDNPVYYRDYSISLSRTGHISDAEQVLEKARILDLDTDSLSLLDGEIAFAKKEYVKAMDSFETAISSTGDDYIRYHAYHALDEIFKLQGEYSRSVALLEDSLSRIPYNRIPEMTERLANAYIKIGDYANAIRLFEQMVGSGVPRFHIIHSLAFLLQSVGDYDGAEAVLDQMLDLFPNSYVVPMRQAYLEAERQSKKNNEDRNYALTRQYYDTAVALYRENVKAGESDPEMQQLDLIMEQLRMNKWID